VVEEVTNMNEDSTMRAFFSFGSRMPVVLTLGALALAMVSGCGGGSHAATLVIVSPANNSSITLADDVDAATDGLQIDVLVESTRLTAADGDITVYVEPSIDRSTFDPSTLTPAGTGTLADDGTATLRATLADGDYDMIACAREFCGVRSQVIRISVSTGCATITFTAPSAPTGGRTVLGPEDDQDGNACGESFQTTVSVSTDAGNGATVSLMVNGISAGSTAVAGTVATFPAIVLGNRGATPNTLSVTVTRADGVSCSQDFPGEVMVDCMGVSCALTQPDTARAFLNADDDASALSGFQTNFVVQSDADAVGQSIKVVLDGDEGGALSSDATAGGGGATASFGPIDLAEGLHRAQAICSDSAGNVTRSSVGQWTVDTTPCGVSVTEPVANTLFIDADDVDASTDGIQVNMTGTSTGADCSVARVGICSSTLADGSLSAGGFSGVVTLASSPMQELCAEVEDAAGNVAEARVSVRVRTDAPQLEIVTPSGTPAAFNSAGDATHGADMNTATPACDVAFSVNCTDVDSSVTLVREDTGTSLGTANCDAMAGLPSPFTGQATFAAVALPSVNAAAGSYNVFARQTVDRLTGTSTPLSIAPDCDLPSFSIVRPLTCIGTGTAVLRPTSDDGDPVTPGFQYTVRVSNSDPTMPDVDLQVDGSTVATSSTITAGFNVFTNHTFTTGGTFSLGACGTDGNGNLACSPACSTTIVDLPTVNVTAPTASAILGASDDCDGAAAGFQVRVRGTTDAVPAGTTATVTINGGTAMDISGTLMAAAGGAIFDACVDAPQGAALPIVVAVTDARGTASGSVTVTIDSMPPTAAITDLATGIATDRRGGRVPFTWTAVADAGAGGALSGYEMRCAKTAIATEAAWTAAALPAFPIITTPGSPTSVEMEIVAGFRVGETMHCTMRGTDITGAMTPIGNDDVVTIDFLEQSVTGAAATHTGWNFAAVGDVNGDSVDDFAVGGVTTAYLFWGVAGGVPTAPAVTFTGFTNSTFTGLRPIGIGDFNGDGVKDFALSSGQESGFKGAAYIIYGHASAAPWPATVDMASGGCGADVCLRGMSTPSALSDVQGLAPAGDFDGDGLADVAVGISYEGWTGATAPGGVYVIRGSATLSGNVAVPGASGSEVNGFRITTPASAEYFGSAITSMGDIDVPRDGRADLVIGDGGSVTGHVYVAHGRAHSGTGLTAQTATLIDFGPAIFGDRVMNIGDYDGNGHVDLAVLDESTANRGRIIIYPGSGGNYSAATRFVISNDTASPNNDLFGRSIAQAGHPIFGPMGDLDRDGRTDPLIGSVERGTGAGSVELFYGDLPGARARSTANHSFQPAATTGSGARTCGYIGDVDGDGFADFAVGDPNGQSGAGQFWIEH